MIRERDEILSNSYSIEVTFCPPHSGAAGPYLWGVIKSISGIVLVSSSAGINDLDFLIENLYSKLGLNKFDIL